MPTKSKQASGHDRILREQLFELLRGGQAHVGLQSALNNFPSAIYAKKPRGVAHNAWQMLEHIRFTLHDLLEFCTNPKYQAPKWPGDYWPKHPSPSSTKEWKASVKSLNKDLKALENLICNPKIDLYAKIPWGSDHTFLREILLACDHTSYHIGQLVMLRKQLNAWND